MNKLFGKKNRDNCPLKNDAHEVETTAIEKARHEKLRLWKISFLTIAAIISGCAIGPCVTARNRAYVASLAAIGKNHAGVS